MSHVTWVLESDVFEDSHPHLRKAIDSAGHRLINWQDRWWEDGIPSGISGGPILFHGSLGNASAVTEKLSWAPGSFCNTPAFYCSAWYESARQWLLHSDWRYLPADEFVATFKMVADSLGCKDRIFVRPDSPLKPFSGRVLNTSDITLRSIDHGFYFDDETLPVIVAPVRNVSREWRFVVVRSLIIAGSSYDAATRSAVAYAPEDSAAWSFAASVASALPPPSDVYVLDVCECDGELRLLELNPFGGADLYACDPGCIVDAITEIAC